MRRPSPDRRGITTVLALFIAVALGILFVAIGNMIKSSSREYAYLESMNRTSRLAETGMTVAIGKLAVDPSSYLKPEFSDPVQVNDEDGEYQNTVEKMEQPITSSFYIVTSATRTVHGKSYSCRLHTYAQVSNVSDYFAAISDYLSISDGINVSQGKIYSYNLNFLTNNPAVQTQVYRAEFVKDCTPPRGNAAYGLLSDIAISTPDDHQPVQLPVSILFPQILSSDIDNYRSLAGPHTSTNTFKGEIYPPGYSTFTGANSAGDVYLNAGGNTLHTTENKHHVYFFDGNMYVQGRIHGQVLFVASGDIHITSSVVSATDLVFPGAGTVSSSTAHQAVFITKQKVYIDNSFYKGPIPPVYVSTETIEALIISPTGTMEPQPYADSSVHTRLSLNFKGAMILGTIATCNATATCANACDPTCSDMKCLPCIFQWNRTLSYMDTLKTYPPPYLPGLTEIHYSLEETGAN